MMRNPRAVVRQERIVQLLARHGEASINQLVAELGVSGWTIRRDLEALAASGQVRRRHGMAQIVSEVLASARGEDGERAGAKQRIGEAAVRLLRSGQHVALGAGSTTREVARALAGRHGLTIVTNALDIAATLAAEAGVRVTCTGGDVHPDYSTLTGPVAERALRGMAFDVAVIGVSGIDVRSGLTSSSPLNAGPLALMIENAHQVVVVADHTKFGRIGVARLGALETIDVLVTDESPPAELGVALQAAGVWVVVA
jgi:DeoR family transcriptional regulator, aga operon transcriptional repressor